MPRPLCTQPPAIAVLRSALPAGAAGAAPTSLRLIPAGPFRAPDGRPADAPAWQLDGETAARLVADMAARKSARYVDYEHATLHAKTRGTEAPAAGWFDALEWRPESGLFATGIQWTPRAATFIAAQEYRYISPLFSYEPGTGRVLQLLGASLTNDPGLDGLTDLAALAAHLLPHPQQEPAHLNPTLAALLLALGISEKPADETAALNAALAAAKTLQDTLASLQTNVAALTARADTPDPGKFAPIATLTALQSEHAALQAQLAALSAKSAAAELDQVIESARTAGKITPALESWARTYGSKDLAGLTAYLSSAPVIVPPGTQTGGKSPAGGSGGRQLDTADAKAVAEAALSYQTQQAQAGITVDTVAAVAHVLTTTGAQ